eukprot:1153792-Pelagomonas_calceolata.AAC.3
MIGHDSRIISRWSGQPYTMFESGVCMFTIVILVVHLEAMQPLSGDFLSPDMPVGIDCAGTLPAPCCCVSTDVCRPKKYVHVQAAWKSSGTGDTKVAMRVEEQRQWLHCVEEQWQWPHHVAVWVSIGESALDSVTHWNERVTMNVCPPASD